MISKLTFTTPIAFTDGTGIPAAQQALLIYTALCDTVNPPLKPFAIPAAALAGGVANSDGSTTYTVAFSAFGFTPVDNTTYFVAVTDTLGATTSVDSNITSFGNAGTPMPPSKVSVA